MSKDQNQMVSGIKGSHGIWDVFEPATPAEVHQQGPEPDGKWD